MRCLKLCIFLQKAENVPFMYTYSEFLFTVQYITVQYIYSYI